MMEKKGEKEKEKGKGALVVVPSLEELIECREDDPLIWSFLNHLLCNYNRHHHHHHNNNNDDDGGGDSNKKVPMEEVEKRGFEALKSRPACVYHNYKALGLSLCFESSLLQAIHLYNGSCGFSSFEGDLPHRLRMDMCGCDIVSLLGEPDGKIGGGRRGPISLAYKEKGLQFNLRGNDWEDEMNPIDSITLHKPL